MISEPMMSQATPIGAVHPAIPAISRACDWLQGTIFYEPLTAEDADRIHSQLEGAIERLQVLSALALMRAGELTGEV